MQNSSVRCEIVRCYLAGVEDHQIRLVCFLWSRGYSDRAVKRRLKITWPQLHDLKSRIAADLLKAGIRLRE